MKINKITNLPVSLKELSCREDIVKVGIRVSNDIKKLPLDYIQDPSLSMGAI